MSAHIYLIIKREGSERKMYTEWYLWIVALFYYLKIFCKKFMDDLLMPLKAFFLLETCLIVCEVPYLSLLVFGEHSLLSVVFRIYFFFVVASFALFACGKVHSTLAFWKHYVKFLRILAEFFLLNDFETAKNVSLLLNIKIWYIISVYIELVIKQFS